MSRRESADALSIERIAVHNDRVICDVELAPDAPRCTSPQLMEHVLEAFPNLPRHACVNDEGSTFAAVMDHTSLPHLLEHLVIDFQTAESSDNDAVFVGTTTFAENSARRARIEVSFTDDLVALRAFRDASLFLNEAVVLYRL